MERSVSGAELQLFQEQGIIVEGKGVEDVEFGLGMRNVRYSDPCDTRFFFGAYLLRLDEQIINQYQ